MQSIPQTTTPQATTRQTTTPQTTAQTAIASETAVPVGAVINRGAERGKAKPTASRAVPNQAAERRMLRQAMENSDEWVVEFEYRDAKGVVSRRVVSPIRFVGGNRLLGLCLSREAPRQFYLDRCRYFRLQPAHVYLMPVPLRIIASGRDSI